MLAGWLADFMGAHAGIFGVFIEDKKVNLLVQNFTMRLCVSFAQKSLETRALVTSNLHE